MIHGTANVVKQMENSLEPEKPIWPPVHGQEVIAFIGTDLQVVNVPKGLGPVYQEEVFNESWTLLAPGVEQFLWP